MEPARTERQAAEERTPLPETQTARRPAPVHELLRLQRAAGNRTVQRLVDGQELAQQLDAARGRGRPLDADTRLRMEAAFGRDFGDVRLHEGEHADLLSNAVDARAFATGNDVFVRSGEPAPATPEGTRLLAHELAHVVQQGGGPPPGAGGDVVIGDVDDPLEHEADEAAEAVVVGEADAVATPAGTPTVQRQPAATAAPPRADVAVAPTRLPTVDESARNLTLWLAMPNPSAHREEIFQAILLVKDHRAELPAAFESHAGRDLLGALKSELPLHDFIRARSYLREGTLRLADKVYFTVHGAGTDEDTLFRLLPEVHAQREDVEKVFRDDYADDYGKDADLPQEGGGKIQSRLAGVLESELSKWELDKGKALLAFGKLRPVDEIRIATNRVGTDEDLLFGALERGMRETTGTPAERRAALTSAYKQAYDDNLDSVLWWELSGSDLKRARLILEDRLTTEAKIDLAVEGLGTDEKAIFDAIAAADDATRERLEAQFADRTSDFYKKLAGDLGAADMRRVEALLKHRDDPRKRRDTALDKLAQAGAESGSEIVKEIKLAPRETFELYAAAYRDATSDFRIYVDSKTSESKQKDLKTIVDGTIEEKLMWAVVGAGTDEDYIFHVLGELKDNAKKAELSKNTQLMEALRGDLSTRDMARVYDLLTPTDLPLEERVAKTGERIERERSWITDLVANASDALSDEHRELRAAADRARADGKLTPEEQQEIERHEQATDAALEVYKTVREEIESTAETIVTTAAAILVSVLTIGAASGAGAAMIAAAIAKAAVASAVVKVLAMKAVHGDRFDILGADGAIAFGAGAIEGAMAVVSGPAAKALVGPALETAATEAAEQTARSAFRTVGRELVTKAVEGGLSSAPVAAFTTAANENTWKEGFAGVGDVALATLTATGTGAAGAVTLHMAGKGVAAVRENWGAASESFDSTTQQGGAPPEKVGPAARIPEDPGAFAERGYFSRTTEKSYVVRAGPPGSYGDHLFASLEEAQAYARQLAAAGEDAIRETSALPRIWAGGREGNPIDAIRVFEVPPDTPYVQGVVGPQTEAGAVFGAPKTYAGGGPQVVIDKSVRLGPPAAEFPVGTPSAAVEVTPPAAAVEVTPPAPVAAVEPATPTAAPRRPSQAAIALAENETTTAVITEKYQHLGLRDISLAAKNPNTPGPDRVFIVGSGENAVLLHVDAKLSISDVGETISSVSAFETQAATGSAQLRAHLDAALANGTITPAEHAMLSEDVAAGILFEEVTGVGSVKGISAGLRAQGVTYSQGDQFAHIAEQVERQRARELSATIRETIVKPAPDRRSAATIAKQVWGEFEKTRTPSGGGGSE